MKIKKKFSHNKFIWWYEPEEENEEKEETMKREKVKKQVDKKVFRTTAAKTKEINVNPKPMRGGIRL